MRKLLLISLLSANSIGASYANFQDGVDASSKITIKKLKEAPVSQFLYGFHRMQKDLESEGSWVYQPSGYKLNPYGSNGSLEIGLNKETNSLVFNIMPPHKLSLNKEVSLSPIKTYCENTRKKLYTSLSGDFGNAFDGRNAHYVAMGGYWASIGMNRIDQEHIGELLLKDAIVEVYIFNEKLNFDKCTMSLNQKYPITD